MRTLKSLSLAAAFGALALLPLHADEWDKKTIITINAPVQIPSTTLQPGTYTLKLVDSSSDRHIVTVWDKDGMHLITTLLAIPNYRLKPTGKSTFTFWEVPADQTAALRAWFYPGDNFGQEFAYPKAKAQQLAMATHSDVPTLTAQEESKFGTRSDNQETSMTPQDNPAPAAGTPAPQTAQQPDNEPAATASSVTPEPMPAPAPVAAAPEPTPAPAAAPDPTPAAAASEAQEPAATAPAASAMPETASNRNEMMSFGMLLGLTGLSTFLVRKKGAQR